MSVLAVVTGTRSGLGKAVDEALRSRGIACLSIARTPGPEPHITADLAQVHDWPARLGPKLSQFEFSALNFFDIAAILPLCPIDDDGFEAALEEAMRVNVINPLAIGRALLEIANAREGRLNVVHVSSGAALRPIPGWDAYCISKAAAAMAWRGLEQAHEAVTATLFQPGVIATDMQAKLRGQDDPNAADERALRDPDEVALDMLRACGLAT